MTIHILINNNKAIFYQQNIYNKARPFVV